MAAARRQEQASAHAASLRSLHLAAEQTATAHAEQSLALLIVRDELARLQPSLLAKRRWHLQRDQILRVCAEETILCVDDARRLHEAIETAIHLALVAFPGEFQGDAASKDVGNESLVRHSNKDLGSGFNEGLLQCASLCSAGAQACARTGKRLLARRMTAAAVDGNGAQQWEIAAALWERQSSFLRGVHRGPDSKVDVKLAMSLDNVASARANASLARSRGSADKSARGRPL